MKFTDEQINLAQSCSTAEELVEKAAAAGMDISYDEAQKYIDSFSMEELDADELDNIAGGCSGASNPDRF